MFEQLSQKQRGIFMIAAGFILLFHTIGILVQLLSYILIAASLAMIAYGLYTIDFMSMISQFLKKQ